VIGAAAYAPGGQISRPQCLTTHEGERQEPALVASDAPLRPYAGMVEAYYGQLLVHPEGKPYGTFIHFDLESRSIAADEIGFLRETVPLFMKQLA
jgi:hypothetical protein